MEEAEDVGEEEGFARQREAAGGRVAELLLGLVEEGDEDREVQEPGRDDEAAALRADVDSHGAGGGALVRTRRFVGIGVGGGVGENVAAAPDALGFPAGYDLLQPHDFADHVHFLDG